MNNYDSKIALYEPYLKLQMKTSDKPMAEPFILLQFINYFIIVITLL